MSDTARMRRRLERLAWLLDDSIRIPVLGRRIGLDSVLGLVPVVGDLIGGALSATIIVGAVRLGVTWPTLLRMLGNAGVEMLVGAVPLLGDLFDMGWKANRRNVALLQEHFDLPGHLHRASRLRVFGAAAVVLTLVLLMALFVGWLAVLAWRGLGSLPG